MKKRKTSFLIDLHRVKVERQNKAEQALMQLYENFFDFLENEGNIREKVRAKQLFSHKTSLSTELLLKNTIAPQFEHWYGFDYVTVIGSRMFDIFVRKKQTLLSKNMLDLCGFMMLMTLEPVRIIDKNDQKFIYQTLFEQTKHDCTPFIFKDFEVGDLAFIRPMNVGFKKMSIGPSFTIEKNKEEEVIDQLQNVYDSKKGALKKHLKEDGIHYLRYKRGER